MRMLALFTIFVFFIGNSKGVKLTTLENKIQKKVISKFDEKLSLDHITQLSPSFTNENIPHGSLEI